MLEIVKPFFRLTGNGRSVVPIWIITSTLLKLALLKRLYPHREGVAVKFGKDTINAPGYQMLSALLKEKFVDNEYYFECSNNAPVIIDGGSNIGVSVLFFKYLYPDAEIHCFEPFSKAYDYLKQNMKVNRLEKIFLNNTALSDAVGTIDLFLTDEKNTTNPTSNNFFNGTNFEKVPAIKLSDYLSRMQQVDLVKLDIESSEVDVVAELHNSGAFETARIGQLIIEFHASVINDPDASNKLINLLKTHSYAVDVKKLYPDQKKSDLMIYAKKMIV